MGADGDGDGELGTTTVKKKAVVLELTGLKGEDYKRGYELLVRFFRTLRPFTAPDVPMLQQRVETCQMRILFIACDLP